ncbi:hypothetical protein PC117_g19015 [Phytophthora cactorum]|uniref:Uncharacterized protein n=1 Tax=Phytophthora cactorum TaxID=29920 RepID=A0A8T1BWD5_9STRA|nr:hypothetical protein PC117_g19015 [Phytophthora cactorum]
MTFELAAKATRLRPARDSSFDLSSKNASNRKCDCIQSTGHYSLKPYASKRPGVGKRMPAQRYDLQQGHTLALCAQQTQNTGWWWQQTRVTPTGTYTGAARAYRIAF